MKNLLAAVDFSGVTDRVVAAAEELARLYGAKLWLLHCAGYEQAYVIGEIPAFIPLPNLALPGRFPNEYRKLAALTQSVRSRGIDAELIFVGGTPGSKILAAADEHQADLIIMGSHGHGGLRELLMGSSTRDVLHQAATPILIIPARSRQPAAPATAEHAPQ